MMAELLAKQEDSMREQIVVKDEIDNEWVELMLLARELGLSTDEVRAFLNSITD